MTISTDNQGTSTRPYLLRALHDWCTDNGFTPYIAVHVDSSVQVPMEHVKNNEIVLNVGFEATSGLKLGNEVVEFRARFSGVSRDIVVPVDHVVAIYARENGQGMAFPVPTNEGNRGPVGVPAPASADTTSAPAAPRGLRLATGADSAAAAEAPVSKATVGLAAAGTASSVAASKEGAKESGKEGGKDSAGKQGTARGAAATDAAPETPPGPPSDDSPTPPPKRPPQGPRPALKRIK